jgi:hypothetical protein
MNAASADQLTPHSYIAWFMRTLDASAIDFACHQKQISATEMMSRAQFPNVQLCVSKIQLKSVLILTGGGPVWDVGWPH